MQFHPQKCEVISITRARKTHHHDYHLLGVKLKHVNSAKYLGVTITSDMCWNDHINNITNKANRSLGFLRRNVQVNNTNLKTTAYKALVRPQLEYASTVWDPWTETNIRKLEAVQRTAARYITNSWHNRSSVDDMISVLGWPSLAKRRLFNRITMMYKITHQLVAVNADSQYITPALYRSTRTHPLAYHQPQSTTNYHKFSFFPNTVSTWNRLPTEIASASSLEEFKKLLHLAPL